MASYYCNTASGVEDGLTMATGYHLLSGLLGALSGAMAPGDDIILKAGQTFDESAAPIFFSIPIGVSCHGETIAGKPVLIMKAGDTLRSQNSWLGTIGVYDINIRSAGAVAYLILGGNGGDPGDMPSPSVLVERCLFDNIQVQLFDADTFLVRSNCFKHMLSIEPVDIVCESVLVNKGGIIGNVFYDCAAGAIVHVGYADPVRVVGNIFHTVVGACVAWQSVLGATTVFTIDKNIRWNSGALSACTGVPPPAGSGTDDWGQTTPPIPIMWDGPNPTANGVTP